MQDMLGQICLANCHFQTSFAHLAPLVGPRPTDSGRSIRSSTSCGRILIVIVFLKEIEMQSKQNAMCAIVHNAIAARSTSESVYIL